MATWTSPDTVALGFHQASGVELVATSDGSFVALWEAFRKHGQPLLWSAVRRAGRAEWSEPSGLPTDSRDVEELHLLARPDNSCVAVWRERDDSWTEHVRASVLSADLKIWSAPEELRTDGDGDDSGDAMSLSVAADDSGAVLVSWLEWADSGHRMRSRLLPAHGSQWLFTHGFPRASAMLRQVSVASVGRGVFGAVWRNWDSELVEVATLASADRSWTGAKVVGVGKDAHDVLLVGDLGQINAVAWQRFDDGHVNIEAVTRSPVTAAWGRPQPIAVLARWSASLRMAHVSDGHVVAAWENQDADQWFVQAATWKVGGRVWTDPVRVSADSGQVWDTEIVAIEHGVVLAIWVQKSDAGCRVEVSEWTPTGWSEPVSVGTNPRGALFGPGWATRGAREAAAIWRTSHGDLGERLQCSLRVSQDAEVHAVASESALERAVQLLGRAQDALQRGRSGDPKLVAALVDEIERFRSSMQTPNGDQARG